MIPESAPSQKTLQSFTTKKKKANLYYLNRQIYDSYLRKDFQKSLILLRNYESINDAKKTEFHLYMLGLIHRQLAQFDKSLNYFKQCYMMNKLNFEYLKEIAKGMYVSGKHKAAFDAARDACQLSTDQEILCIMGNIELYLSNLASAKSYFEKSIEIEPNDQAYIQLAEIYKKLGKDETAYATLQQGLKYSFENSNILNMMGVLSMSLKYKNVEDQFEKSLDANPKDLKALLALGCSLQDKGQIQQAMIKYRLMHNLAPNSAQLWNNVGLCLMQKDKNLAAFCCLRKAVFFDPFEWKSSANLGMVCLKLKKFTLASVHFATALSLNPKNTNVLNLLGVSLTYLNDFLNAENAFSQGIAIERATTNYENSSYLYTNYFLMLLKKGDKQAAEKVLGEAEKRLQKQIGTEKLQQLRNRLTDPS